MWSLNLAVSCVLGCSTVQDESEYVKADDVFSMTSEGRRLAVVKPPVKSSTKETSLFQNEKYGYCVPVLPGRPSGDTERGQGVGEEDRPQLAMTARGISSKLPSPSSPDYTSLDEVPADVSCLTVHELLQCLRWLNLDKHVETFRAEQIDGELLVSLDQQVLVEELGFKRLDAIKLERFARHGWRPKLVRTSPIQYHLYYQQKQQQQPQQYPQPEPLYTDV